jgi:hypothetical protein
MIWMILSRNFTILFLLLGGNSWDRIMEFIVDTHTNQCARFTTLEEDPNFATSRQPGKT